MDKHSDIDDSFIENNASYLIPNSESESEIPDSSRINESVSSIQSDDEFNHNSTIDLTKKPGNSMISESEENTQVITDDEDAIDLTSSASEYSFNDGNNQTNAEDKMDISIEKSMSNMSFKNLPNDLTSNISEHSFNDDDNQMDADDKMDVSIEKSMSDMSLKDLPNDAQFLSEQEKALLQFKLSSVDKEIDKLQILANGNLTFLPDKGEAVRKDLKQKIELKNKLQTELDNILKCNIKVEKKDPNSIYLDDEIQEVPILKDFKKFGATTQEHIPKPTSLTIETLQEIHKTLVTMPGEDDFEDTPENLKVELKPHQKHALAWMMWRENQKPCGGVLADDMGLGKTLTTIALIMKTLNQVDLDYDSDEDWISTSHSKKLKGQTLIVSPASLLSHWVKEVEDKCKRGTLSVEIYHGANRQTNPKKLQHRNIVVTTYHTLSRDYTHHHSVLYQMNWNRVILDEAHTIRNFRSGLSKAACGLTVKKTWALTGTPIQNKEFDLYPILKFLKCSPFDELHVWKRIDNKNVGGHRKLATIMKSIMLRRTKEELKGKGELIGLPQKTVEIIDITLDPEENQVYQKMLTFSQTLLAQFLAQKAAKQHGDDLMWGKYSQPSARTNPNMRTAYNEAQKILASSKDGKVDTFVILVLLLRLRQLCCHPALIHSMLDVEDYETNGGDVENVDIKLLKSVHSMSFHDMSLNEEDKENESDNLLTSTNPVFLPQRLSSKMRAVIAKIEEILEGKNKLVVVSQWVSLLNVVASKLNSIPGAKYEHFNGQTPIPKRQSLIDAFNDPHNKLRILLLSLTAGGVGLNLIGGNNMLILDLHWNPQLETQVQDRIYRLGQKKDVSIYKFICRDTIEEKIKHMQEIKLEIAENVLTNQKVSRGNKLTLDDLKSLFGM